MAAGAASVAGSAVMGGAANLAGGGSAIKAAFDKAQASMSSGSDMPSMGGMSNSSPGGTGTNAGSSPFAQAAGFGGSSESGAKRAVSLAAGTAGNLAKGIGSMAAQKFKDRVADTAGGRLASSLRASSRSFEGNSLAGSNSGEHNHRHDT